MPKYKSFLHEQAQQINFKSVLNCQNTFKSVFNLLGLFVECTFEEKLFQPYIRLINLKRHIDFFGGRVLTDEKSGQKILRSIFNPTHHFVLLCLDFLAV
jgi:hypothetical protein